MQKRKRERRECYLENLLLKERKSKRQTDSHNQRQRDRVCYLESARKNKRACQLIRESSVAT